MATALQTKIKVLIVDDSAIVRKILNQQLSKHRPVRPSIIIIELPD